jgi:hypothetical protein
MDVAILIPHDRDAQPHAGYRAHAPHAHPACGIRTRTAQSKIYAIRFLSIGAPFARIRDLCAALGKAQEPPCGHAAGEGPAPQCIDGCRPSPSVRHPRNCAQCIDDRVSAHGRTPCHSADQQLCHTRFWLLSIGGDRLVPSVASYAVVRMSIRSLAWHTFCSLLPQITAYGESNGWLAHALSNRSEKGAAYGTSIMGLSQ